MPIGSNIPRFDFTTQDPLAHKVIMHLDVLCASMEHGVLGQLHATNVVLVDRDQNRHYDLEVLQSPPKPYGFTDDNGRSFVLSLGA